MDLYLSAYIIIEIHVLTLLWERRAKEDFTVCACDSSMQHTTSSASDSSRYSDIQGGNTRRSNIYHVFRCWSAMQINPQLKRWNFETRRFKACIYIYIHTCKISSYHSHVTEFLMILDSKITNLETCSRVINSRDYIRSLKRERERERIRLMFQWHGCSRVFNGMGRNGW